MNTVTHVCQFAIKNKSYILENREANICNVIKNKLNIIHCSKNIVLHKNRFISGIRPPLVDMHVMQNLRQTVD